MSKEMLEAFDTLEKTKGIKKEVIVDAIKAALVAAYKKNYNQAQNVEVDFDERTGNFKVMAVKTVVDEVQDDRLEVSLKDALAINGAYEVGDEIRFEVTPKNFGRISAQTAKQVIMQRLREAERNNIIDEYSQYEDELITGTVERRDNRFVYVKIGNVEAVMSTHDQMPNETYNPQDKVRVLVTHVGSDSKGAQITVSRTAPDVVNVYLNKKYLKFTMVQLKLYQLLVKQVTELRLRLNQMILTLILLVLVLVKAELVSKMWLMN